MTNREEAFPARIAAKRRELADNLSKARLCIAVLGPNLEEIRDIGTVKRHKIADALVDDGHEAFFPEMRLENSDPDTPWVEQERKLLSDSTVDLVVILNTEDSGGVLIEIGNFISVPEIHSKTAILFPGSTTSQNKTFLGTQSKRTLLGCCTQKNRWSHVN